MASSIAPVQSFYSITNTVKHLAVATSPSSLPGFCTPPTPRSQKNKKKSLTIVANVGDSADGTTYLVAGAAAVSLIGTAFPILFSHKDLAQTCHSCPKCDEAGFVRKSGATLRANAARKDQVQIVCARCNDLGKLSQIDK